MGASKLETSLDTGGHYQLLQLIGKWSGTSKTFFEPGVLSDESAVTAVIKPLFDKRFVQMEYQSSLQGNPFEGWMILGLHLMDNMWQMAWMDTFHMGTGIMHAKGVYQPNKFDVLGQYSSGGEDPQFWSWRTIIEKKSADQFILTAYNISPEGQEDLAVEMTFMR